MRRADDCVMGTCEERERRGYARMALMHRNILRGWGKPHMMLIRISGAPTKIRIGYPPDKSENKCVTAEPCILGFSVRHYGNQSLPPS